MEMERKIDLTMEIPLYFRCPISMEVMKDPVTISTGVTYERKNIEKWFFRYQKKTCPATMQPIEDFHLTPNHTLKRLILSWQQQESPSSLPPISIKHDELMSLMTTIESTPLKVTSLKKLRSIIEMGDEIKADFVHSGGIKVLCCIITQILIESCDFVAIRACEEALNVLYQLPLSDEASIELLSKPECMKCMAILLQHGKADARSHAVTIFHHIAEFEYDWNWVVEDQGMDLFKSLLELISSADDIICKKASSYALDVLIQILSASKKNRFKAIEAGAVCVLIELLPNSNPSKCEKLLLLIKLLCECAEGRLALVDHALGIAAISNKILCVSDLSTKIGIKILWLICSFHPTVKVIEEMLIFGSVNKLVGVLHVVGQSSTKDRVVKIIKLHGNSWKQYPCFPSELKDYLRFLHNSN